MGIEEVNEWYVLRAKYNRALMAQKMLAERSIDSFVPMESRSVTVKGNRVRQKLVPILLNLIFVKTTFANVKELQIDHSYLYYVTHEVEGVKRAMTVPNEQMSRFIDFVEGNLDKVEYIDIDSLNLKGGEKIRVLSGPFQGKEGIFVKVKGKRSKQFVVSIDGLVAVMVAGVGVNMIEKI